MDAVPALEIGDVLPNLLVEDAAGATLPLYEYLCGEPLILLAPQGHAVKAEFRALDAARTAWPDLKSLALLSHAEPAPGEARRSANFFLRGEPAVLRALGVRNGVTTVLAVDRRLRLIGRFDVTDAACVATARAFEALQQREVEDAAADEHDFAPVLFVPDLLSPEECAVLIAEFEQGKQIASGMQVMRGGELALVPDAERKSRRDVLIASPHITGWLGERLSRRLLPEIERAFGFRATRFEPFKLVRYDAYPGGYFRPHRDNIAPDVLHRRFAMTLNLNTGNYLGGGLRFGEFGRRIYHPARGGAIVFSCGLAHEVLDVTAGARCALLSFFFSEEDELKRQHYAAAEKLAAGSVPRTSAQYGKGARRQAETV